MATEVSEPSEKPATKINSYDLKYISMNEKFQQLNCNQMNLAHAIIEFIVHLKFEVWDDNNHSSRGLRNLPIIMELMDKEVLTVIIEWCLGNCSKNVVKIALDIIEQSNEIQQFDTITNIDAPNRIAYCFIILLIFNSRLCRRNQPHKCLEIASVLLNYLLCYSKQLSPIFCAKIIFQTSRIYDICGKPYSLSLTWFKMLNIYETLRYDEPYATLVNLITRTYIRKSLWSQAENFIQKCKFPKSASNSQQARYSYSRGLISMLHREYRDALCYFSNAFTSGQNLNSIGFLQTVKRGMLLSKLLLGEYPDRRIFIKECYFHGIQPYFDLVNAVKLGDPVLFTKIIKINQECYVRDSTSSIVLRLHHNVLKGALVNLGVSYSCISLADIAKKLKLESNDVEFIVAKSIKDGIINAQIDHQCGIVNFKIGDNVYRSYKPQKLLTTRMEECFKLYTKFVTSMTYPQSAYLLNYKKETNPEDMSDMESILRHFDDDLY